MPGFFDGRFVKNNQRQTFFYKLNSIKITLAIYVNVNGKLKLSKKSDREAGNENDSGSGG